MPIDALQPVVNKYLNVMSRADQWALAGLYAAELSSAVPGGGGGQPPQANPVFPFPFDYTGRVDCDATTPPARPCINFQGQTVTCSAKTDNHNVSYPSPDLTTDQLLTFMADTFQFDAQETVAIMGAHTLGVASRQNSGFPGQGGWDNTELRLDNNFYVGIVGPPNATGQALTWNLVKVDNSDLTNIPDRYVWFRTGAGDVAGDEVPVIVNGVTQGNPDFMLSADIALVRDFSASIAADGQVSCRFGISAPNACPFAKTISQASEYRVNNNLWLNDFRDAFTKMTLTGYNPAQLVKLSSTPSIPNTPKPTPTAAPGTRTPKPTPTPTSGTKTPKPSRTAAPGTKTPKPTRTASPGTKTPKPTRMSTPGTKTSKPTRSAASGTKPPKLI